MADWVCTKNKAKKKKGESRRWRRKENGNVCEKTHQGDKMGIVHVH